MTLSADALSILAGVDSRWNISAALGTPVVLTYSFNTQKADYDGATRTDFAAYTAGHRAHVRDALDTWAAASGISFLEVPDALGGQIRFSMYDMSGVLNSVGAQASGFAYRPQYTTTWRDGEWIKSTRLDSIGGDVFLNANYYAADASTLAPGQRGYSIVLHEIGHALGLKHPFEGTPTIDPAHDNGTYTIMSYTRPYNTTQLGTADFEAMSYLYGNASFSTSFNAASQTVSIGLTAGHDSVVGTELADVINGLAGNDWMFGWLGNDVLIGGAGRDTMIGGQGDDRYYVDATTDVVVEYAGEGKDRVYADATYVLPAAVEELVLRGTANINGVGNDLANLIYGNAGANALDGKGGRDYLAGGDGNDTYYVERSDEIVREALAANGVDRVVSSVSYRLGNFIEYLTLTGSADIKALGNAENNKLIGNVGRNTIAGYDGADLIYGKEGLDSLLGGAGRDRFVFDTALNAATNVDRIGDFSIVDDTIILENAIFTGLATGSLAPSAFHVGASATTVGEHVIYDATSGSIYFDADGVGGAAQVRFAILTPGLALTSADFYVI